MLMSWRSLALSSFALLLAVAAVAETRPRYGGTLRMVVAAQVRTLDPLAAAGNNPALPLLYDTLVVLDRNVQPQPSLAVSWQSESERRLQIRLRQNVTFSDGSPLTAAAVAASLRSANPGWTIRDSGGAIGIETDEARPSLLAELALPRNAIVLRSAQTLSGTGAFVVKNWQPGATLVLEARADGWRPRPFLDAVEIRFGRDLRERSADFDFGRADWIELASQGILKTGSAVPAGHILTSEPAVLWALRFSHTGLRDPRARQAVSLAIDRDTIANTIFQRHAEAAAGLLPNWITGYSFLFSTAADLGRARQLRAATGISAQLTLVYRAADPLARLVADRVALNLTDAGFNIRTAPDTQNIAVPDMELLSVQLAVNDPAAALVQISTALAVNVAVPASVAPAAVYSATLSALNEAWAAPLIYVPVSFGTSARVHDAALSPTGQVNLDGVWLEKTEERQR